MSPENWQASAFNKNNSRAHSKSIFCCSGGGKLAKKSRKKMDMCECVCVLLYVCSLCKEQQETNKKMLCYSKWKSVVDQKRRCPFQPNGMLPWNSK